MEGEEKRKGEGRGGSMGEVVPIGLARCMSVSSSIQMQKNLCRRSLNFFKQ